MNDNIRDWLIHLEAKHEGIDYIHTQIKHSQHHTTWLG